MQHDKLLLLPIASSQSNFTLVTIIDVQYACFGTVSTGTEDGAVLTAEHKVIKVSTGKRHRHDGNLARLLRLAELHGLLWSAEHVQTPTAQFPVI